MREELIGRKQMTGMEGYPLTCTYRLLIRTLPEPADCESYGVGIRIEETGEQENVFDITVSQARIESLAELLLEGGVTPCTLRDVIEDWL